MLKDLVDIRRAHNTMYDNLEEGVAAKGTAKVGFPGGTQSAFCRYDGHQDMWWIRSQDPGHSSPFGLGDPWEQSRNILLRITCKTNHDRRTQGAFVRDGSGRVYIAHTGMLGGNHKGEKIPRPNPRIRCIRADDGREDLRRFYLISDITDGRLAANLKEYLLSVHKKKEPETIRMVKRQHNARQGQARFRAMVLNNFHNKCAVCGISDPRLLEAAHIRPVRNRPTSGDRRNGICLCVLHHKMFDVGYLYFDDDYTAHFSKDVSKNLRASCTTRRIRRSACDVMPSKRHLWSHSMCL